MQQMPLKKQLKMLVKSS
uniref:Uncharacterized protein n=1 Tax=Brassica juncea TaxID=3707 RepID=Q9G468_BRAJU|nr:unknown [Brassica juncea]